MWLGVGECVAGNGGSVSMVVECVTGSGECKKMKEFQMHLFVHCDHTPVIFFIMCSKVVYTFSLCSQCVCTYVHVCALCPVL